MAGSDGPLRFDGRVALVTGAGRGLGRAHARLLAERGAAVVVNDVGAGPDGRGSDPEVAEAVAAEIAAAGGRAVASTATVATADGAESMVALALERFGRLDIVVNNAGTALPSQFPETPAAELEELVGVHLGGSYNVTRAAWPHLAAQRYGRVVMTTSAGIFGVPDMVNYGAAKGGVWVLARGLATVGAGLGIQVNAVAPHAFTIREAAGLDMTQSHLASYGDPAYREQLAPEHASPLVAWLVHESCPTSGELFYSGGGLVMRLALVAARGYGEPGLSPEAVRDHWARINDLDGASAPGSMAEFVAFREPLRSVPR